MSKSLGLSVVIAAALGVSSLGFAATGAQTTGQSTTQSSTTAKHGSHHARHGRRHRMGVLDQLDLSATQKTAIKQMMRQSFEQARPEMQALMQKRMAFESATPGSSTYQSATTALASAESTAASQRVTREAALRTNIYNELTSAQRTKLASLQAEHRQKMQAWRAKRMQQHTAPASSASK